MKYNFLLFPLVIYFSVFTLNNSLRANNNLFLPGDAFFPTKITAEKINRLISNSDETPMFNYSSLGGYKYTFSGYAGYGRAQIPNINNAFLLNLKRAYERVREYRPRQLIEETKNGKLVTTETNGVEVLFYPKSFAFPRFSLGLRYNENWADEVIKFGHNRRQIRLCCLINKKAAVVDSWRDSKNVAALNVSLPNIKLKPTPATETPITINEPVKAIVIVSKLNDYFEEDDFSTIELLVVDSEEVIELIRQDGRWARKKINGSKKEDSHRF